MADVQLPDEKQELNREYTLPSGEKTFFSGIVSSPERDLRRRLSGAGSDPVISGSGVRRYTGGDSSTGATPNTGFPTDYNSAVAQYYGQDNLALPDEDKIRREMRDNVQAQIDTINDLYANIIAEDQRQGGIALGRTRASAARGGLIGSDFGNAQLKNTEKATQDIIAARNAEKAAAIAEIYRKADERADRRIDSKTNAAIQNRADYISYLKGNRDEARNDVTLLAKSGVSLDDIEEERYKQILDQTGYTEDQLRAQFVLNKPEGEVLDEFVQGNQYVVVSRNPDGSAAVERIDLGFEVPKEYNTTKLENGQIAFFPKSFDPNKTLDEQIMVYGPAKKETSSQYNIPKAARNNLLGAGMTNEGLDTLEQEIRQYGMTRALEGFEDEAFRAIVQEQLDKNYDLYFPGS